MNIDSVRSAMTEAMARLSGIDLELDKEFDNWMMHHNNLGVARLAYNTAMNSTIKELGAAGVAALGKTVCIQDSALNETLKSEYTSLQRATQAYEATDERIKQLKISQAIQTTLISGFKALISPTTQAD